MREIQVVLFTKNKNFQILLVMQKSCSDDPFKIGGAWQ